jgi:hypothetical protein
VVNDVNVILFIVATNVIVRVLMAIVRVSISIVSFSKRIVRIAMSIV